MYRLITLAAIAVLTAADQLFKLAAEGSLAGGRAISVIPGVLSLRYVQNYDGMWGLFEGKKDLLSVLTVVIIAVAVALLMAKKIKPLFASCCVTAIVAGGLGNLIDRVCRDYVIDYIATDFINFPTYNFADCLITAGCFALMGYELYELFREYKSKDKNIKNTINKEDDHA